MRAIGNNIIYKLGFDGAACETLQKLSEEQVETLVTELTRLRQIRYSRDNLKNEQKRDIE